MKSLLTHLYDSYTGWFLLLVALIGAAAGGALAFDPAEAPVESGLTLTPTPARAAATPASISIDVPTPTAGPTALPEIGTVVAPFPQRLFRDPDGFTSAPVMGPGGAIYLSSPNRTLHAVDRLGQVIWQAELPAAPVGDLVLAATGEIVVVDRTGRLAAYTPEGELSWALPAQEGQVGVSGAVRAPDGSFYFTLESGGSGLLTAAGPDGSLRWQAPIQTTSFRTDPWVYPDGSLVFLREEAFSAETGQPAAISFPFAFDQLMTAADGTPFLQSGLTFAAIALVDGAITLPEEGLRYTIPEAGVTVRGAFLNPAGMSWISYLTESTDTLTWFNPDGTIAHQVTSTTMLISSILALDGEGTLYACALSPRMVSGGNVNDRTTYCLAYRQGEETHRWQERLASTPKTVIGSFRHDAEIFFATEDGDLYVLGRAEVAAAPTAPATPETSGAVFLDNGWYWRAPTPIISHPRLLDDGTLAFLLQGGDVFFFDLAGSLLDTVPLPEHDAVNDEFNLPVYFYPNGVVAAVLYDRIYAVQPGAGQLWEFPITVDPDIPWLQRYPTENVDFLLDSNHTLYAFTAEEGLLWDFTFEAGLRSDFVSPEVDPEGRVYFADMDGTLTAFDRSGVAWTFHPGGTLRGASDPVLGPDGNIYYITTTGTSGYLESITPEGAARWHTKLETFRFYFPPQFTAGGSHARVSDDFVRVEDGFLQPVEFPFDVQTFIAGADGQDYVLTGSHIIRWRIGTDGFEQLQDLTINLGDISPFIIPAVSVYSGGLIEITVFDEAHPGLFWVDPQTMAVRRFDSPWSRIAFRTTSGGPEFVQCSQDLEARLLTCSKSVPESPEPVWSLEIQGIDGPITGFPPPIFYRDGRLIIIAGEQNVYVFDQEIP